MTLLLDLTATTPPPAPRATKPRRRFDHAEIRRVYAETHNMAETARQIGCGYMLVKRVVTDTDGYGRDTQSRHRHRPSVERIARLPSIDSPFLNEARTRYPSQVVAIADLTGHALKPASYNAKIGGVVRKGPWEGFPIYALTLEERATCPTNCRHWRSCYGNTMHLAERLMPGPALEKRLANEVLHLATKHRRGFVVRLHNLGDFYSVDYVDLWAGLIEHCAALRVFGYTSRYADDIGTKLQELSERRWDRFAMRFSNAPIMSRSTVSIEHPFQKPADAIICPEQLGKTESCSTCGLCWHSRRRIAFLQH